MFFKFFFIFLFIALPVYSDQNDSRLDALFQELYASTSNAEINKITNKIWNIWIQTNDSSINADFNNGLESMHIGEFKESIYFFSKVIDKNPNFAEAWNKRATVYYILGDFNSSILDIKETLKLEPRHFGALDGLGLIFIHLQQFENAIEVYDQILKIFPNNPSTLQKREHLMNFISKST